MPRTSGTGGSALILALASALGVVAVIGGYLKQVTSQRYPGRRARRDD
ncbi:MAG: hypothetical protein R2713_17315 [Ilumatobacteraceae bacterium]